MEYSIFLIIKKNIVLYHSKLGINKFTLKEVNEISAFLTDKKILYYIREENK